MVVSSRHFPCKDLWAMVGLELVEHQLENLGSAVGMSSASVVKVYSVLLVLVAYQVPSEVP